MNHFSSRSTTVTKRRGRIRFAGFAGLTSLLAIGIVAAPQAATASDTVATNMSVKASSLTLVYGQTVKLTSTLTRASDGAPLAWKNVTWAFSDFSKKYTHVTDPNGQANYSSKNNVGTYTAGTTFAGDSTYGPSSGSVTYKVVKANTTTTITAPASAKLGVPMTVKVNVDVVAPGGGIPQGTVSLWRSDGPQGQAPVYNGVAYFQFTPTSPGFKSLTAVYTGMDAYKSSAQSWSYDVSW